MKRFYSFFLMAVLCCCAGSVQAEQINEGFENTGFPPADWSIIHVSGSNYGSVVQWARNTSYKKTGSACAYVNYSSSGHENYLVTPQLQPAAGEKLSFYVSAQSYAKTTFTVEVSTASADKADFTNVLATYTTGSSGSIGTTNPSTFVQKEIDLADYVGQNIYIAFHVVDNDGSSIYLDDVTGVSFVPVSCPKPSGLAVSSLSANAATITWMAGGEETQWQWACVASGVEVTTWSDPVSVTSASVSGLSSDTDYDFYVRAYCGSEDQSKVNMISFYTGYCTPAPTSVDKQGITAIAFNGDAQTSATHKTSAPYYANNSSLAYSVPAGGTAAINVTYSTGYTYGTVIWVDWNNNLNFEDDEVVYTGTSGDANPTTLDCVFDVPATQAIGSYRLRIGGADSYFDSYISNPSSNTADPCSNGTYRVYEDYTLNVTAALSCAKPSDLAVNNVTAHSAVLSWTSEASAWQICVNGDSENLIDATTNPFTLTGLTSNTNYNVKVRTNCGEGDDQKSDWTAAVAFKTNCDVISTFPWNENFEGFDANTIPECWDNSASASTTINGSYAYYIWGVYVDNDNKLLRMNNFNVQAGTALINSPVIELPASPEYELTFDYAHNASCDDLIVKISEDNGANWTNLKTISKSGIEDRNSAGTMTEALINLSAYASKTIMLQFFTTADYSQGAIFLDNISIHEIPACSKPTVNDPTILPDGATISWTAGNGETRFEYACVAKGAEVADTDWILLDEDVLSVTINGKASGTECDVYVRAYCSASEKSEAVKKTFKALCPAPSALQVSAITSTTATISWTAAANVNDYEYVVMEGDAAADWTSATLVEGAVTANLTKLTAATTYTVYVRSHYSDVSQSAAVSKSFTTECATFAMPFSENFNSLSISGKIPACWNNDEGTTTSATSKWSYNASGHDGACVRFNSYSNSYNTNVLASPTIHLDKAAILSFWCKNPAGGAYEVKIAEAGSETRVTLFDNLTAISAWTQKEADLSDYVGKDIVIYFCGTSNNGYNDAYLYLDDVEINEKPACSKPMALQISNIEVTSAKIAWTAGGSETAWALQTSLDGETWSDAIAVTNPYTLSGLSGSTKYYVRVKAVCSSEESSAWSDVASFITACAAIVVDAEHPWVEDFSGHDVGGTTSDAPHCWDMLNANEGNYPYIYVTASGSYGLSVDNNALYFSNQNSKYGYAILPVFETALNTLQIAFSHKEESASSSGKMELGYMTDIEDEATFELLKAFDQSTTWTSVDHALTDVPSGARLALRYIANSSTYYDAAVDNITVSVLPSCAKPSDVQISNIAQTSATIAWTAGGDETAWQICLNGDEDNLITANANPFELTDLTPNTAYSVKVRAICGEEYLSDWSNAANFRTECGDIIVDATHSFFEGFEEDSENFECWGSIESESFAWAQNRTKAHSGSYSMHSGWNGDIYLVMPTLVIANEANKDVILTFWSNNKYASDYEKNSVVLLGESEVELWSPESVVEDWVDATISLNDYKGQTIQLAFKYDGSNAHDWYLDDVTVEMVAKTPTGIDNTVDGMQIIKRIENGLLLIEVNGVIYNAQGEVVTK